MSLEAGIYFAAILLIGVPAGLRVAWPFKPRVRNATALAMVAMWFFGFAIYCATGEGMPIQAMIVQDMVVIAAIYAKQDWRDCSPYTDWRHQFCAAWLERSPWDRGILALFPLAWLLYFPILSPILQFWTLWSIGLAQLMLAGLEAFHHRLGAMAKASRADNAGPPGLTFSAWERGYG